MPQPEGDALALQLSELAERVARIERELGLAAAPTPAFQGAPLAAPAALLENTAMLPLLGHALLGLAGAYLLRALTESGTLAPVAGVAVGSLYAVLWLVPGSRRVESAIYSLVAALVMAPLLWEATQRFHALTPGAAAALLLAFTLSGLAVSWRKDFPVVATIVIVAGLLTNAALLVATHDVLPFVFGFLAIAAAVEAAACLDHWPGARWLAAIAADLAVLLATWLVHNEHGLPPDYAPIPTAWLLTAQLALLAIYLFSTIVRTLLRGFVFTAFETAQVAQALVPVLYVNSGSVVAVCSLACGAACYGVSFLLLDRPDVHGRNFYTYSTFAILLTLAGTRMLLAAAVVDAAWLALAVACVWAGGALGRRTLQVHGALYLLLGCLASGAAAQAAAFLLRSASWPGEHALALLAGAVAAAFCYRLARPAPAWYRLAAAAVLAWLSAGIAAGLLTAAYHALAGETASHAYCDTMRTAVLAFAALFFAWAGSRWKMLELSRLIYPAMALAAWLLGAALLQHDRTVALFLSLFVYGAALMLLPRLKKSY